MVGPEALSTVFVVVASALAGFVDAVVGGGGLVLLPALFAAFPAASAPTLLGTSKSASVWGTAMASVQYARRVQLNARVIGPTMAVALLASAAGARLVMQVDTTRLKQALPLVLLALLVYTLARKDLGREHRPRWRGRAEWGVACTIGAATGFYDGFFGPGTGSFLVFLFVRVLGHDFLHASAHAKLVNLATNAAALATFAWAGHVWWHLAVPMAVANVLGAALGARLALQRGTGFVRGVFILVVALLIAKTGYDAYAPWWQSV
jgi:uncharacterized protein